MKKHSADLLVGMRAIFSSAYQEMESPYSVSNEHVEPFSVESLERTADEVASILKERNPPDGLTFHQLLEWYRANPKNVSINHAITHGTPVDWEKVAKMRATKVLNNPDLDTAALKARQDFRKRTHTRQDDDMIDGLAYACQMISDCARMASKPGALKIDKVEFMDMVVTSGDSWFIKKPKPTVNKFDAVKMAARQARINRNAMRVYPVIKSDAMARTRREHDLATAIERTQLPHEMTIHERIMPYRVKE